LLIIGAGGAGLRAAVEALKQDVKVLIVTKSLLGKAHTVMAEGGIAASLGNVDKEDNWKVHFVDTYVEGVYLGDWRFSEKLAKDAPARVLELEEYGALFDRNADGKILQRAFGAHTYRRLCHVGDKTGLELIRTLQDKVIHSNASFLEEVMITKIISDGHKVKGAIGLDFKTGEFYSISAKGIILASGGLGRIYKVTSNSWESTGDGLSLAFEAGAELMDLEMVQFHPTGMIWPPAIRGLLVTEGVRGDGGLLYNSKGERFMLRYSPQKKELDARDVVARSIYREIMEGRGTEHGGVYLDISYKGAKFILEKLPSMYMQYKEFSGVDITKEKMEVAPTTHYHMGGIKVDAETNQTVVSGLFAAGEAATGLHGANRLGGNSLADLLVFGKRTGEEAAKFVKNAKLSTIDEKEALAEIDRVLSFLQVKDPVNPYEVFEKLREAMSSNVGIWRNEDGLNKALAEIAELKKLGKKVGVSGSTRFNPGLVTALEVQGLLNIAEMLVTAARERKESRGAHYRQDYPDLKKEWRKNIVFTKKEDGSFSMRFDPVPELPAELKALLSKEEQEHV
jgi:succinate dehydrogenase / fumarate reductase flavoprotein subunit